MNESTYPRTDEQKLYQLSVNKGRMKKLVRRTKPIVDALDRMYRDGFCETELLLAIWMAGKVFDEMQDGRTCLGAALMVGPDECDTEDA